MNANTPHRSAAWPLAAALAVLVFYASWYPFTGWRWPSGAGPLDLLMLPWPRWRVPFDEWANFLGYVLLGLLLFVACRRSGLRAVPAAAWSIGLCALLSLTVEIGQQFLPSREPSLKDCAFNLAGALAGAGLGHALHRLGVVDQWHELRQRWFERDSAWPILLLVLWPVALLFPAPVPFALGHVGVGLAELAGTLFEDTALEEEAGRWAAAATQTTSLSGAKELLLVGLGLLAPIFVAYACTRPGWHRLLLLGGALALGTGVTTLSTALNFGPQHALGWWSAITGTAFVLAALTAMAAIGTGRRLAAALGLVVLAMQVALVAEAPSDPYFAASLQAWEQGRFIRFHGLAQWIGWAWPFATIVWLLVRLARRREE